MSGHIYNVSRVSAPIIDLNKTLGHVMHIESSSSEGYPAVFGAQGIDDQDANILLKSGGYILLRDGGHLLQRA